MRIVLQRVLSASVTVDNKIAACIDKGYLLLLGFSKNDSQDDCRRLADKIINLRIFTDQNDKINLSLKDVNGEILVVSQFTLYADCRKGNRPNFIQACNPVDANALYEYFIEYLKEKGQKVKTGIFGACMKVKLENDGPFTVILE